MQIGENMKKECCPTCGHKMVIKKTKVELSRGTLEMESFKCQNCGEELFTSKQVEKGEELAMAHGIWGKGLWLERKVTTIGNSNAIVIPSDISKELRLAKGSHIKIGLLHNEIIIKPERLVKK